MTAGRHTATCFSHQAKAKSHLRTTSHVKLEPKPTGARNVRVPWPLPRSVLCERLPLPVAAGSSAARARIRSSQWQPPRLTETEESCPVSQHDSAQPRHEDRPTSSAGHRRCLVVAVDGPSGTGKSTVSQRLALRLGVRYLDTGAMYRAATLAALRRGVDLADVRAVVNAVDQAHIEISTNPDAQSVVLDGERVDGEIRSAPVTAAVSAIAAVAAIRARLVRAQRDLIGGGGIVVEGRDIGSVVWPTAEPKIFLTADAPVRARRRASELGADADPAALAVDIERRDRLDSTRTESPLAMVTDAIEIDTTFLDIDEVVNMLIDIVRTRTGHG